MSYEEDFLNEILVPGMKWVYGFWIYSRDVSEVLVHSGSQSRIP